MASRYSALDWGLLLLRVVFGFRILYGVVDNVFSWERMMEFSHFLGQNGFPLPTICAVASVYLQFLCGLSWMAGYKVRITGIIMVLNFLVAIFGVHVANGDSYLGTAPAIHMLTMGLFFFLAGGGEISLEGVLKKKS